ncbi:hypothetical protein [Methylobacterium nodulans]|uniref:Uncharacterized protein n=1 Tax=Methylobacterium nodulans (strain LMG 21967 / CNCM I-2342 / ORS 2060) TaxID=460265 RepID=B8IE89_METNO|nr:hypothetical protein [Methylobacterium nodulans]ACL57635.1 conserved hypothetical protein [Methylobacterium nodulans ORS 2060]
MQAAAAPPRPRDGRHHLVVGATASALCLTSHLLRQNPRAQVTLIERKPDLCRLLRRQTYAPILRTGVADGERWWPIGAADGAEPRLSAALREAATRLHVAEGTCTALGATGQGVAALLDDGTTYLAQTATITVAGSPAAHGAAFTAKTGEALRVLRLDRADLPLGTGIAYLIRWLRDVVREAELRNMPWTEAIDGVRLHAPEIWHHLPPRARASVLRHGRRAWHALTARAPGRPGASPQQTDHPLLAMARTGAGGREDRIFTTDPAALMPYAAGGQLLDLDVACAWLATRIRDGGVSDRPESVPHAAARPCATW